MRHRNDGQPPASPEDSSEDAAARGPAIPSSQLLKGRREILIEHDGETYRLRLTRNGKLILHK